MQVEWLSFNILDLAQVLSQLPAQPDNTNVPTGTRHQMTWVSVCGTMLLSQTGGLFHPITNDPEMYGAIAASNALNDVYAMGANTDHGFNRQLLSAER